MDSIVSVLEFTSRRHEVKQRKAKEDNEESEYREHGHEDGPEGDLFRTDKHFDIDDHDESAEHKVAVE